MAFRISVLVCMTAAFAAVAVAAPHHRAPDVTSDAVEEAMRAYAKTLQSGSPKEVAAWYTADGELLLPGVPALHGREAIRAFLGPLVSVTEVESLATKTDLLEVSGSTATQWGTYRQVAGEKGKPKATYEGRYSALWHREAGGQWRLARLMMQPMPSPSTS